MTIIQQSAVRNRVLAAIPPEDFERLAESLALVELPFKRYLHEAERRMEAAYFIEAGMISYLTHLSSGQAMEVGVIGSEGIVGGLIVCGIDRAPTSALIQLPGSALRMSKAALRRAFNDSEALRDGLLRSMQALHLQVAQTAACNGLHLLDRRLARWLLMAHDRVPGDRFPMTHEFMGLMLGVRRSGVTVAAGTLRKAGLIDYANGEMTVLDRPGLEAVSCECYAMVEKHVHWLHE